MPLANRGERCRVSKRVLAIGAKFPETRGIFKSQFRRRSHARSRRVTTIQRRVSHTCFGGQVMPLTA
jgi:hypothetical protein